MSDLGNGYIYNALRLHNGLLRAYRLAAARVFFSEMVSGGRRLLILACVLVAAQGCVTPSHRNVVNEVPPPLINRFTCHFPFHLYTVAEGDVLELVYLSRPTAGDEPYRIQIKDALDVEFAFHPELNRTVRVKPDGTISVPRKRDVKVVGRTVDELSSLLTRQYRDVFKDPQISVNVREYNVRLEELQRAIGTAAHGQARLITVRPDGKISLPLANELHASGMTIPALKAAINKTYEKVMPEIQVSVMLRETPGHVIFVDGEVARPGVFSTKGPISVQQAIARAGGTQDTAEPRSVLVVSKDPSGKFMARLTDLTSMTSCTDFMLRRNDLVYVPKSKIARADIWVDQNIKRLLLFTGWSAGIQADLGRTTFSR